MLVESDGVSIRAYLDSNSWSLHLAGQRNCWGNSERKVSKNISLRTVSNQPDSNDHGHVCVILLCCFHCSAKSSSFFLFLINQSQISKAFRLLFCNKQHVICQLHHFLSHWSLLHTQVVFKISTVLIVTAPGISHCLGVLRLTVTLPSRFPNKDVAVSVTAETGICGAI